MSAQDAARVREIAKAIVQRAITDAAFGEQLRADPRSTALEAGLPETVVDDFINHDLGMDAEVAGYLACGEVTCIFITQDPTLPPM